MGRALQFARVCINSRFEHFASQRSLPSSAGRRESGDHPAHFETGIVRTRSDGRAGD